MQRAQVQYLVQEDPTCPKATEPMCHDHWSLFSRAHALQQQELRREACGPQRTPQLDKVLTATKTQHGQHANNFLIKYILEKAILRTSSLGAWYLKFSRWTATLKILDLCWLLVSDSMGYD